MLRRNGVGTSTALAPIIHAEDAQPNEMSKKRKGQGLPPIVASSKPPARAFHSGRGGGRGTIRGGYRGGNRSEAGISTQYAMRGGKSSWRGSRRPSGNWPRRADNALPSPHDPSSSPRPVPSTSSIPLTAGQTGIDKGKAPIQAGDQGMHNRWRGRDGVIAHRNYQQDGRIGPWGQQPDSGYAQRAGTRTTSLPKDDGPSPAPSSHAAPRHPSLPAKPPSQSSAQSPPQSTPRDSEATVVTEWYLRAGSPDPKLPAGSLGRKNPQPQSTISMPLPGRLRKMQDRSDARGATEVVPVIPPQPETITSLPMAAPVHQKPESKPELSQVPIPPDVPKDLLPKRRLIEKVKPANDAPMENLPFVPPVFGSSVYKSIPLSEQRKSNSRPRDTSLPVPPQAESSVSKPNSLSQQSKAPSKPQSDAEPTTAYSVLPFGPKSQPQPPRQSKAEVSVPVIRLEIDTLSFLAPQSASNAYVPVPLSLQRQSRLSLYAMSTTPDVETDEPSSMPPQELLPVHEPAPLPPQSNTQKSRVVVDLEDPSRSSSRTSHSTCVNDEARVPQRNHNSRTDSAHEGTLKPSDDVLSRDVTVTRATAPSTSPFVHDLVTPPPPEITLPAQVPPMTPKKAKTLRVSNIEITNEAREDAISPAVAVKKEEQLSPLSRLPITPLRKLVTEAASYYPMPASCDKSVPEYKENRKSFFKKNSKILNGLGLKRTKAFFRDDGLVIEWKSDVPVWSDTLKPEENNLATAMEEFLRQSAERSGGKHKRKERIQDRDAPELSPGAKRARTYQEANPLTLSERKKRITDHEDTPSPEKRRKTAAAGSSSISWGPLASNSSSQKSDDHIATNSFPSRDFISSKDEPIYILSSPESSPKAASKPLPSAAVNKVPLPTRLHLSEKSSSAPSFAPSTTASNSMSNSSSSMSTSAAGIDPGRDKLRDRTRIDSDPAETIPPAAIQTGVRASAPGPPPSRRMVFKPTKLARTSRVPPAVHASASAVPAEDCDIDQHGVGAVNMTDLDPATAPTHLDSDGRSRASPPIVSKDEPLPVEDQNSVSQLASNGLDKQLILGTTETNLGDVGDRDQRENNSDIYCSEHENVGEDDEDEDDESKLAVEFFTRFITYFDSDRSKLVSAYAKNALFTCRVHDMRPQSARMSEHFAPDSKLIFHSSHSNASASTVEHGRHRICDRLRTMGPHKFRGSVVWDLAPLPLDSPGHLMFSVHGEVVDPSHAGQYLDHVLTVDQTFVLRPRTDDDNARDEESLSDSPHASEEWPLVAISHQMTVRESRLLPPDAITNLLPWVVGIGS